MAQAPVATAASDKSPTAAAARAEASPPQAARQKALIAARHALAFAQIVGILMRSQRHKVLPIAALEGLVLPPLLTGQFSIAEARSKQKEGAVPSAFALWARVSPEVDKRLSETLDKPVQLRPREWRSGDMFWLIEAVGDEQALPQLLKHLAETTFKGREVKMRRRGADGKISVVPLRPVAVAG